MCGSSPASGRGRCPGSARRLDGRGRDRFGRAPPRPTHDDLHRQQRIASVVAPLLLLAFFLLYIVGDHPFAAVAVDKAAATESGSLLNRLLIFGTFAVSIPLMLPNAAATLRLLLACWLGAAIVGVVVLQLSLGEPPRADDPAGHCVRRGLPVPGVPGRGHPLQREGISGTRHRGGTADHPEYLRHGGNAFGQLVADRREGHLRRQEHRRYDRHADRGDAGRVGLSGTREFAPGRARASLCPVLGVSGADQVQDQHRRRHPDDRRRTAVLRPAQPG